MTRRLEDDETNAIEDDETNRFDLDHERLRHIDHVGRAFANTASNGCPSRTSRLKGTRRSRVVLALSGMTRLRWPSGEAFSTDRGSQPR